MARKTRNRSLLLPNRHTVSRAGQVLMLTVLLGGVVMGQNGNPYVLRLQTQLMDIVVPVLQFAAAPFEAMDRGAQKLAGWTNVYGENQKLRDENQMLLQWQERAKLMQAENHSLRELLQVVPDRKQSFITASIVSDHGSSLSHVALINAGSEAGIAKDRAVIASHGLIGRVVEVSPSNARVMLLTDLSSRIPVMNERTREKMILVGKGSELPALSYVGASSKIAVGDRIITSGDGGVFAKAIQVGTVESVASSGIRVALFANVSDAEYVSVVKLEP